MSCGVKLANKTSLLYMRNVSENNIYAGISKAKYEVTLQIFQAKVIYFQFCNYHTHTHKKFTLLKIFLMSMK